MPALAPLRAPLPSLTRTPVWLPTLLGCQAAALTEKANEVLRHVLKLLEGLTGWAARSSGRVGRVQELIARAGVLRLAGGLYDAWQACSGARTWDERHAAHGSHSSSWRAQGARTACPPECRPDAAGCFVQIGWWQMVAYGGIRSSVCGSNQLQRCARSPLLVGMQPVCCANGPLRCRCMPSADVRRTWHVRK